MKTTLGFAHVLSLASYAGVVNAIETYVSVQETPGQRNYPIDDHGKLRFQYFSVPAANVTVIGDADSTALLCKLPPGRVRVLPWLSRVSGGVFGASRTLDIGHLAYPSRDDAGAALEATNYEAFLANLDVSAATNAVAFSTVLKYDLYSKVEVQVAARIQGGTWPIGIAISGFIAYIYE